MIICRNAIAFKKFESGFFILLVYLHFCIPFQLDIYCKVFTKINRESPSLDVIRKFRGKLETEKSGKNI